MVMPRREPSQVVRIPVALYDTVIALKEAHKDKQVEVVEKVKTVLGKGLKNK